ncbi:hypothetical protein B0H14DRAFT_3905915 [Mycena olivaceomarginata]|nr:hypothetical protein B0H14DRAFT_3905915 [Mycena olivaceomarginata]
MVRGSGASISTVIAARASSQCSPEPLLRFPRRRFHEARQGLDDRGVGRRRNRGARGTSRSTAVVVVQGFLLLLESRCWRKRQASFHHRVGHALPHPHGNDLCGGRRLPALREINISLFLRVNASCVRDLGTSVQGHAQKCVTLSWCPSLTAPTPRTPPLPALLSTLIIWTLLLAHAEACVFRAVCGLEPWGEWERAARVFGKGGEGEVPKDPSESVRREG